MTVLFLPDETLSTDERNVVEAAICLHAHRSVRSWAQSEGLSYDSVQKVISGQRRVGHLSGPLSSLVREARLEDRLTGGLS